MFILHIKRDAFIEYINWLPLADCPYGYFECASQTNDGSSTGVMSNHMGLSGMQCIPDVNRCDGVVDCPGSFSDEMDCPPGKILVMISTHGQKHSVETALPRVLITSPMWSKCVGKCVRLVSFHVLIILKLIGVLKSQTLKPT